MQLNKGLQRLSPVNGDVAFSCCSSLNKFNNCYEYKNYQAVVLSKKINQKIS